MKTALRATPPTASPIPDGWHDAQTDRPAGPVKCLAYWEAEYQAYYICGYTGVFYYRRDGGNFAPHHGDRYSILP